MKRREGACYFLDSLNLARATKHNSPRIRVGSNAVRFSERNNESKKGEMSIGMIIAIVIGVVILTFSIYAISHYKSNLNNRIDSAAPETTVDDLVLACNNHLQLDQQTSFCCDKKILKTDTTNQETTCDEFASMDISNNRVTNLDCKAVIC